MILFSIYWLKKVSCVELEPCDRSGETDVSSRDSGVRMDLPSMEEEESEGTTVIKSGLRGGEGIEFYKNQETLKSSKQGREIT